MSIWLCLVTRGTSLFWSTNKVFCRHSGWSHCLDPMCQRHWLSEPCIVTLCPFSPKHQLVDYILLLGFNKSLPTGKAKKKFGCWGNWNMEKHSKYKDSSISVSISGIFASLLFQLSAHDRTPNDDLGLSLWTLHNQSQVLMEPNSDFFFKANTGVKRSVLISVLYTTYFPSRMW